MLPAVALLLSFLFPSAPQDSPKPQMFAKSTVIYVSDFDLDAQNVQTDKGGIVSDIRPGILERPRKKEQKDPEYQANKLKELMAKSITEDLIKAGYNAKRLMATDPKPTSGAWLHGVFTQVDEGNSRRRAIIGFGAGEAKMDLYVTLTDLSKPDVPLYTEATQDTSGKKIGAVVTMNPYVAAAKFVMEKNAPEKTVKATAKQIAAKVETHFQ